jgi:DNA-binding response OmpR family regulator
MLKHLEIQRVYRGILNSPLLQRKEILEGRLTMKARILWVEGKRADRPSFVPGLRKKGYAVESVSTGEEALALLPAFDPDLMVVNAASMRTSGKRICRALHAKVAGVPLLLIIETQRATPSDTSADVILALPFTARKLINRIKPLLPGDGNNLLHTGVIRLDMERKRVRCQGREATLTPRMALLLKIFMDHPGEVLERGQLFRDVWNTEYTGDTRTLDVHISWLRQALEVDPRRPVYLKTIRGVGYRLDV